MAVENMIYIDSDNIVEIEGLRNSTAAYIEDATITMSLFEETMKNLDVAAAEDAGGGKTKLPCTGHGVVADDYIRIQGTNNYDGEYAVDSIDGADKFIIVKAYAAETFTGKEEVFTKAIKNGTNISLPFGTTNTWADGEKYLKDSVVMGTDSKPYKCVKDHISATATNKPITGSDYTTCWERVYGYYSGYLPDNLVCLVDQSFYYLFFYITKDTSNLAPRRKWQSAYYPFSP